jgi:hypothetical protein
MGFLSRAQWIMQNDPFIIFTLMIYDYILFKSKNIYTFNSVIYIKWCIIKPTYIYININISSITIYHIYIHLYLLLCHFIIIIIIIQILYIYTSQFIYIYLFHLIYNTSWVLWFLSWFYLHPTGLERYTNSFYIKFLKVYIYSLIYISIHSYIYTQTIIFH